MRTRERKRPDRRWVPWSAAGTAAGRLRTVQLEAHVERLEARSLMAPTFQAGPTITFNVTNTQTGAVQVHVFADVSGLGNDDLVVKLTGTVSGTIDCTNNGGNLVESHTETLRNVQLAPEIRVAPKNGRAIIDTCITIDPTSVLLANATCPNPNWTPSVHSGTATVNNDSSLQVTFSKDGHTPFDTEVGAFTVAPC